MDQPQPLVIRLHQNVVAHKRQDEVWFQSDSSVVFQHADINTIVELQAVFLYQLGGGFMEIRKVGYRYLQRQPDGRFQHLLVWLFNDEHIRVTFRCHRRLMPQHVMDFLVEVGRIPVAATPVWIADPPGKPKRRWVIQSQKRMIPTMLRALHHPRTRRKVVRAVRRPVQLAVPQLDLDEGASSDPLNAGIGNDYNTDGGEEIRVGHWMRNRQAVQTAVKNYSIRRNAEYRVIESDIIKYHCRCKHAADGCP
ncbi:hypothetical protein PIB30_084607 [Stylosanthes scabra]|uniref:Transposase MuDR plant domain-containing protein n=1 Tax=Stylosanthes scabra TaxID=79078 RepID=A0ABU6WSJ9_9FABA|nr:hypothetical protein [Stylosanthes scabra]